MNFKNFVLDPFQVDAVKAIEKNHSVVVSAATGTGKTLIADYIIDKYLKENKRIIYTAPIKALSGQKYRDFKNEYGEENIGIMTGDIVINPDAPVLIMTTEIYRNMLLAKDEILDYVKYAIFDEIHFINDIERGTVWEESIIFSPEHIRFLCLSATIPNAHEFADWISHIKNHPVDVVKYDKRAVPLEHFVYDSWLGVVKLEQLMEHQSYPDYYRATKSKTKKPPVPSTVELVKLIQDKLPCIIFHFSRNECVKKALEIAAKMDFGGKNKHRIIQLSNELISSEYRSLESIRKLKQCLSKGVAFHHAGLLPKAKELVERLFADGVIKVLLATETFAVGINMPAKTVCFSSLEKYDGFNFRYLNSKEYFQMAGRAGRRGIDNRGYVIAVIQRNYTDLNKIKKISTKDDIPIQSQFRLSYNTVLNLIKNHTQSERELILTMNFDYFLKKKSPKQVRVKSSYNHKLKILKQMGFVHDDRLTNKGEFATKIYDNEILISEIFCTEVYKKFSVSEINILVASIIYEPRTKDYFTLKNINRTYSHMLKVLSNNRYVMKNLNKLHLKRMIKVVGDYSEGGEFTDLLELSNLDEGDLIRLFRRIIDMLRQIRHATANYDLADKITEAQHRIYRDVIKFEF